MSSIALVTVAAVIAVGLHQQQAATRPEAPAQPAVAAPYPLERGRQLESEGRFAEATRVYRDAAATGNGAAARRLGDLYLKGAPGVERDMAQALRWYREAELRGEVLAQAIRLR